uniref:Neural cell adhesion molecule 2-like isoform X2 n=1 Tax=Petromyzon marinus TaxID=7757 RepID=A0AAJ7TWW0_PETMA|nr:neural cell adhesion molecule 2-like isoform X2 [Petromyzon marinus]
MADQEIAQGRDACFRVKVSGEPAPSVSWYKDNVWIHEDARHHVREEARSVSSLSVLRVAAPDAGTYSCRAVNSAGTRQCQARLEVTEAAWEEGPVRAVTAPAAIPPALPADADSDEQGDTKLGADPGGEGVGPGAGGAARFRSAAAGPRGGRGRHGHVRVLRVRPPQAGRRLVPPGPACRAVQRRDHGRRSVSCSSRVPMSGVPCASCTRRDVTSTSQWRVVNDLAWCAGGRGFDSDPDDCCCCIFGECVSLSPHGHVDFSPQSSSFSFHIYNQHAF